MPQAQIRTENLDAATRERDHVGALLDGGQAVIARTISTLKRRLPVIVRKDIAADFNLPARYLGSRMRCVADADSVTLTVFGRPVALTAFPGTTQTRAGVRTQIRRGAPVEVAHAFIATPGGAIAATGPQAFVRVGAPGEFPDDVQDTATIDHDRHGYPIYRLAGLSPADMLREGDREDRLIAQANETFTAEVDRLVEVARRG